MLTFTTYAEAHEIFTNTRKRKLGNNTYLVEGENFASDLPDPTTGELRGRKFYGVKLHSTVVVKFWEDGRIELDSGGWHSVTTKQRMNAYTPLGINVFQEKFEWFARQGRTVEYHDGITFPLPEPTPEPEKAPQGPIGRHWSRGR